MSGIYIGNVPFPRGKMVFECKIFADGKVMRRISEDRWVSLKLSEAIPVPNHGDLIDKQAANELNAQDYSVIGRDTYTDYARLVVLNCLDAAPIIIPADKEAGE